MTRGPGIWRSKLGVALAFGALAAVCAPACSQAPPAPAAEVAAATYPTLGELYDAPLGLYAGCGPNNGVCHNSKQFPDLSSLGSIVDHIGDPCNELVDEPTKLHDLCERPGDFLVAGDRRVEIGWIEVVDGDAAVPLSWRIELASPWPDAAPATLEVERGEGSDRTSVASLSDLTVAVDPADARALLVTLPPAPEPSPDADPADLDPTRQTSALLAAAGVPADPASIQVGDPNRNGTFGAHLGGRLIRPGDPERSYLVRRLVDPASGPLMPLANCCHWSKAAVRALWCWIAGLDEDGSNALAPIDYAACPPGPAVDHLAYPEPGEGCEASGSCPIQSTLPAPDEPTWSNVHGNIMTRRCAGSGCHFDGGTALDLSDAKGAWARLRDGRLVVPDDPDGSVLVQRVAQACDPGASCSRMPLGLEPLPSAELDAIRGWIAAGAPP